MTTDKFVSIIERFKTKRILVIGDLMLDKYIWGKVERISPEAPVQVVSVRKESYTPGGASNVASNIVALSAKSYLAGVVGDDISRRHLLSVLKKKKLDISGIITDKKKPTIQKVRILAHNQQLLRVDYEKEGYVSSRDEQKLIFFIKRISHKIDSFVISDYAKGVITKKIVRTLIKTKKPIIVDPKPKHIGFYEGVNVITPNLNEAKEMAMLYSGDAEEFAQKIVNKTGAEVIITMGQDGLLLKQKGSKPITVPTKAKEVYDVTGAGDTFVAVLALSLASNANILDAAIIANHAAGITVGKIGTSTVTLKELKESFK